MYVVKTDHLINATVMDAVYEGLKKSNINVKKVKAIPPLEPVDSCVSYGILRGTTPWYRSSNTFIYIDKSFLRPGHFDGYYRFSINGFQPAYNGHECKNKKREDRIGQRYLILPPTENFSHVLGISPHNFTRMIMDWLQYHGIKESQIEVRQKENVTNTFEEAIKDAALVIAANSGAAAITLR